MEEISLASDAETDPRAALRLTALREEVSLLLKTESELSTQWEGEKALLEAIRTVKGEMERVGNEIEAAENQYDLGKAAERETTNRIE